MLIRHFINYGLTGALAMTALTGCGSNDDEPSSVTQGSSTAASTSSATSSSTGSSESPQKITPLICDMEKGAVDEGVLDKNAKAYILCKHNQTRSKIALGNFTGAEGNFPIATNMKKLQWDNKLEQAAQSWANACNWQHNGNRTQQYNALKPTDIDGNAIFGQVSVGENLSYKAQSNVNQTNLQFAFDGYDAWENEGQYYVMGYFNTNDQCTKEPCGHFTQLVWANSYKVGCAVNFCSAGTVSTFPSTLLVCNYASAGNYIGQLPYDTGQVIDDVCKTRDSGQNVCRNGLTESEQYKNGL